MTKLVKESLNEELSTMEKLIKTAERDGYLGPHEGMAQYIISAAKEVADEWDKLHPEQKKVFRDAYYNKFLKKIKKQ